MVCILELYGRPTETYTNMFETGCEEENNLAGQACKIEYKVEFVRKDSRVEGGK